LLRIAVAGFILAFSLIFTDLFFLKIVGVKMPDLLRLMVLITFGGFSYLASLYFILGKQFIRDFKAIRAGKL
jgi:hypothetical protein